MPVLELTQHLIDNELSCPDGLTRYEAVHIDRSGLYCVATKNNRTGTFYLRFKSPNTGKTSHIKLGRTCDISLDDAMKKVAEYRSQIAQGIDPRDEIKAKKSVPLFSEFFTNIYLPKARISKRSWKCDESLYRLQLKRAFGHLKLNQITRMQVQSLHSELRESGLAAATCDHYIALTRSLLNMAQDFDLIDKNPASGIKLFKEDNQVTVSLSEEELGRLVDALKTHPNKNACNVALFLLNTGLRISSALQAKWEHIDISQKTMLLPSSISKSKKTASIPLSTGALEILDSLPTKGKHEYLFVNANRNNRRLTTVSKGWRSIRQEAGLPKLTLHGLRHVFASTLINNGVGIFVLSKLLTHANVTTTARYSHLDQSTLLDAANTASHSIDKALKAVS